MTDTTTARTAFPVGTVIGYPRIGRRRELKKAVESFWAGDIEAEELEATAAGLRAATRERLAALGLGRDDAAIPAMEEILFRETATLGIRRYPVSRRKLKRRAVEVDTAFGTIRGKLGWLDDRAPTFSPEYDDCARAASTAGVALREVYDATHAAYAEQRRREGGKAGEAAAG